MSNDIGCKNIYVIDNELLKIIKKEKKAGSKDNAYCNIKSNRE